MKRARNNRFGWLTMVVFAFTILITSCRKDAPVDIDMGYNYYPMEIGHYVVYDVTEITHEEALNQHDTDIFQIKEYIQDTFVNLQGDPAARLERYRRDSVDGPWVLEDVWEIARTSRRAEKVEENMRIMKLEFKPDVDDSWDGNVFNTDDEWEYVIQSVDVPAIIGSYNLDSTCTVLQRDFRPGVLFHEYSTETYARNIGLVRTYRKILEISGSDTTDVERGEELFMTLSSWGIE